MSGNLYQLRSLTPRCPGDYFEVNGPYDIHGVVLKSEEKIDKYGKTYYLNQVRGKGKDRHYYHIDKHELES